MKIQAKEVVLKNGERVLLRSAGPDDAENFLKHLRISHAESYLNLNRKEDGWNSVSVAEQQKALSEYEESPVKFMMAALAGNQVIGGLGFIGSPIEFRRHNASLGMSIQKKFGNLGLGRAMLQYSLEQGRTAGFCRVDLTVRTHNLTGIALYEKLGFKRNGTFKNIARIDGEYFDEYSYELFLD